MFFVAFLCFYHPMWFWAWKQGYLLPILQVVLAKKLIMNLWLWKRLVAPTSQWQSPHPCRNGAQSIIYPKQAWWISQKVWCLLKLSFAAWIFWRYEDHLYWSRVQSVPGNCKIRLQTLGKKEFVKKERTWYFRAEDSLFGCSTGNERLPPNIASNYSGHKASRWKNWTLIYSIPCFA